MECKAVCVGVGAGGGGYLSALAVAIGDLRRDVQLPLVALLHQLHGLSPATNHLGMREYVRFSFSKWILRRPKRTWLGAKVAGWPRLYEESNSVPSIKVPR